MAAQVKVHSSSRGEDSEGELNCQYCGMSLKKEENSTHSCRKKPEKHGE